MDSIFVLYKAPKELLIGWWGFKFNTFPLSLLFYWSLIMSWGGWAVIDTLPHQVQCTWSMGITVSCFYLSHLFLSTCSQHVNLIWRFTLSHIRWLLILLNRSQAVSANFFPLAFKVEWYKNQVMIIIFDTKYLTSLQRNRIK
jgi:hypothetical protein